MADTQLYSTSRRPKLAYDHEPLRKTFFLRVGNPLFQDFLNLWKAANDPVEIDLGIPIKGASPSELLERWQAWVKANSEDAENPDHELQCINDLGRQKAEFMLVEAANECKLSKSLTLQKIAMELYLHHRDHFWGVYTSFVAAKLGAHLQFIGKKVQTLSDAELDAGLPDFKVGLAALLAESRYDMPTEFDAAQDATQTILLMSYAYLRDGFRLLDEKTGKTKYGEGRFIKDAMLLFDNVHGTMKMKFGRSKKLVEGVRKLVGDVYFGDPEWFTQKKAIDFSLIADPDFGSDLPEESPFESITVTELVFFPKGSGNGVMTVRCEDGVWDEFNRYFKLRPTSIVVLGAKMSLEYKNGTRPKTVKLAFPNRNYLDDTKKDRQAEELLRCLGVIRGGKAARGEDGE